MTARAEAREAEAAELSVLGIASDVICALPANRVARLAEAEETPLRAPLRRTHPALLGTIDLQGETFVAWDLARLLSLPADAQGAAFIALALDGPRGPLRVALRISRCLSVLPVPLAAALPPALFRRRCGAVGGAFLVPEAHAELSPLGLVIDPALLLSESELALGEAALLELSA